MTQYRLGEKTLEKHICDTRLASRSDKGILSFGILSS